MPPGKGEVTDVEAAGVLSLLACGAMQLATKKMLNRAEGMSLFTVIELMTSPILAWLPGSDNYELRDPGPKGGKPPYLENKHP